MIISKENGALIITAEDSFDWMELFDQGTENEFVLELDEETLDLLCPQWRENLDEQKPFECLSDDLIKDIKYIHIIFTEKLEDLEGEGIYEVVEHKIDPADQAYRDEFDIEPEYEQFQHLAGMAIFKVTPDLPEV